MIGEGYNKYYRIDEFPYNCISYLIDHNEMIWKLLKYNDADAWTKADLSKDDKGALIYAGQDDESLYRVFMDTGQPDVWTAEAAVLRVSLFSLFPDNKSIGTVSMMFEAYSHFKVNHLTNYKTRVDVIIQQVLATLNGVDIGGLGNLYFDRLASFNNQMMQSGQIPYKGKWLVMSTKVG